MRHAGVRTRGDRSAQARRYVLALNLRRMARDLLLLSVDAMANDKQEEARRVLCAALDGLDWGRVEAILIDAAVQVFSAGELASAADYFSSQAGKAWLSKAPQFTALYLPVVARELRAMVAGGRVH